MEYLELLAKFLTPVVLVFFGFHINKNLANQRSQLALNEKLIEKRIKIYDEISSELNDIFQFMVRVGTWKEMSPKELIDKKRLLDKLVHQNRPYWGIEFIDTYSDFMSECFETNTGTGEDAKIKADTIKYVNIESWAEKFESMFTGVKANKNTLRIKYEAFNLAVSKDVNPKK